jgi:hypothetical protein
VGSFFWDSGHRTLYKSHLKVTSHLSLNFFTVVFNYRWEGEHGGIAAFLETESFFVHPYCNCNKKKIHICDLYGSGISENYGLTLTKYTHKSMCATACPGLSTTKTNTRSPLVYKVIVIYFLFKNYRSSKQNFLNNQVNLFHSMDYYFRISFLFS